MDFDFSDEQELLRESVKKFVRADYDFDARKKIVASERGFSRENLRKFAELGWTAIPFSEEDGGLDGSAADTMIVLEEFGKGLVVEPFLPGILFAGSLLKRGDAAQRKTHIGALVEVDKLYAVAYIERDARFELTTQTTRAEPVGDGYRVSGRKIVVFAGDSADRFIVAARTSGEPNDTGGITLFVVDAAAKGVQTTGTPTVDGLRVAEVHFDGVEVPASAVLGPLDGGGALLEQALDEAIIGLGAEALGVMEVLYKSTVAYTKERVQFGVPISSFQALQHRMADMYIAYEEMKSMVYMATMSLDAGRDVSRAASSLKVYLERAGRRIGEEAIQMHGGMGMTEELAVSHYFKRMSMMAIQFGDADYHLRRFQSLTPMELSKAAAR